MSLDVTLLRCTPDHCIFLKLLLYLSGLVMILIFRLKSDRQKMYADFNTSFLLSNLVLNSLDPGSARGKKKVQLIKNISLIMYTLKLIAETTKTRDPR